MSRKLIKLFVSVLIVSLVLLAFDSCSGNNSDQNLKSDVKEAESELVSDTEGEFDYSSVNYDDVAVSVSDYAEMETFLDEFQNGTYDNKVVEIKGRSAHRMNNCSILISNGDSMSRGCSWEIIDGNYPDDYPADDAQVKIKGVLRIVGEYGSRVLMVPADNVEIIE